MNKTGLTLGKFAPLHRGHQFVIETMPAENDEAIVVIYDSPEVTPIPLQVRAAWIEKLYPSVRVIGAWGGPQQTGDSPRIKKLHEDYLIRELEISGITHFYSVAGKYPAACCVPGSTKCFGREAQLSPTVDLPLTEKVTLHH